ncbi:hypothetical protein GCM10027418_25720 [Mariniluteicoccus endophyticus]
MPSAGWYPDPGRQPGLYRYWDGRTWTERTTRTPGAPLPAPPAPPSGGARRTGWIVAAVVVALVAGIAVWRSSAGGGGPLVGPPTVKPTPREVCPKPGMPRPVTVENGRVRAGRLTYPVAPPPFLGPRLDNRIPYAVAAGNQEVVTQHDYQPGYNWYANIISAELQAGDGFYAPKQGAEIIATCFGRLYMDAKLTRNGRVSRALTIDGHDAWLLETDLGFTITGLRAKSERAIIVVVATGEGESSLFMASIPEDAKEHEAAARQAMEGLRVG